MSFTKQSQILLVNGKYPNLHGTLSLCHKMLSYPSHVIAYSTIVLVVPPSYCDANSDPSGDFGNRAVRDLSWPCGRHLSKSQVCILHWRLLGVLVSFRSLYHISQTPNWTCIDGHLSVFVPFLYLCSQGPAKWTCWCCSWPPCSSNSSPEVAAAKSAS